MPEYLYHYTSFESFVKIWLSKQLLFSVHSGVNDILEQNKLLSMASPFLEENFKTAMFQYKQISLTMDFSDEKMGCMSTMLWGHYGKSGHGICIKLDTNKLDLSSCIHDKIQYVDMFTKPKVLDEGITQVEDISNFIESEKKIFFFTKLKEWEHENEYRLISRTKEALDISNAIVDLCVTKASFKNWEMIRKLVGDDILIKHLWFTTAPKREPRLTNIKKELKY